MALLPPASSNPPSTVLGVLASNRDVRTIWFAQLVSETGDWLTRVAVVSHVANRTGQSALAVAGIQALMIVPYFLVSPFAGVLADRVPRRSVLVAADAAAAILVLAYLPIFRLEPSGLSLALLAAVVFGHLALAGVFEAARGALLASVARPHELPAVNTLAQITWSTCIALGSALGGWMVQRFGREPVILVDSATFVAGVVLLLRLRGGRAPAAAGESGIATGILDLFRYLRSHPTTGALILPKLALGFVGMNDLTFALLGPKVFGVSSEESFSAYLLATGIGTAVGPFIAIAIAGKRPSAMRVAIGVAFLLEAAIFSGTIGADSLWSTAAFAGAATAGGATVWVFSTSLLQRAAPDRLAGRVLALDIGLLTATIAASLLAGGALHDAAGLEPRDLLKVTTAVYASGGLLWLGTLAFFRGRAWDGDSGRPA
jgi:predicted MFS family arabinose efflux permease